MDSSEEYHAKRGTCPDCGRYVRVRLGPWRNTFAHKSWQLSGQRDKDNYPLRAWVQCPGSGQSTLKKEEVP